MKGAIINTRADHASELTPRLRGVWARASALYRERYPNRPPPIITDAYRSQAEQKRLYEQGRTKPGLIVTHAKPGESKHNFYPARAFDIAFRTPNGLDYSEQQFMDFAAIVREIDSGIVHGGNWSGAKRDMPHFEEGASIGAQLPTTIKPEGKMSFPTLSKRTVIYFVAVLLIVVAVKKMRG